jgi:hypothetical protein
VPTSAGPQQQPPPPPPARRAGSTEREPRSLIDKLTSPDRHRKTPTETRDAVERRQQRASLLRAEQEAVKQGKRQEHRYVISIYRLQCIVLCIVQGRYVLFRSRAQPSYASG